MEWLISSRLEYSGPIHLCLRPRGGGLYSHAGSSIHFLEKAGPALIFSDTNASIHCTCCVPFAGGSQRTRRAPSSWNWRYPSGTRSNNIGNFYVFFKKHQAKNSGRFSWIGLAPFKRCWANTAEKFSMLRSSHRLSSSSRPSAEPLMRNGVSETEGRPATCHLYLWFGLIFF